MCSAIYLIILDTSLILFFFFFQAEDGIRDYKVTGVQTCALPISCQRQREPAPRPRLLGSRLPSHEVQTGLRAIARRGSLSDLAAVPVEQRERQGEADGRQEEIGRASCRERV